MSNKWLLIFLLWQLLAARGEKQRQKLGANFGSTKTRFDGVGVAGDRVRIGKNFKFTAADNVEDLVGFYEPSFLAQVWPKLKNGMHLTMNNACWDEVTLFMKDLRHGRAWAYKAVDSSGRYESGLFNGNRFWMGSKDQCLHMDRRFKESPDNKTLEEMRSGDYFSTVRRQQDLYGSQETWKTLMSKDELLQRIVAADNTPPYRLSFYSVLAHLNVTKATLYKSHQVIVGVCLPMACTASDVHELFDFSILINDHLKSNKALQRSVKIIRVRQLDSNYAIASDSRTMILLLFLILLALLIIFATMMDLNLINFLSSGSRSFDLEQPVVKSVMATSAIESKTIDHMPNDKINRNLQIFMKPKQTGPSNISLVMPRKFPDSIDMETMATRNVETRNHVNLVKVKKIMKLDTGLPSLSLDNVVSVNNGSSCRRCGRYRKQCQNPMAQEDALPPCPKVKISNYEVVDMDKKRQVHKVDWSSLMRCLLLSFSLKLSTRKIFNTSERSHSLNAVHGIKVFSLFWIINTHVVLIYSYLADNGGDIGKGSRVYRTLASGTYSFDTLFLISGLLSAHHYFCLKNRYSSMELVNFRGILGRILQFVCFVTNRAVRLLPAYMVVIFVSAACSRLHRSTALLQLPERDYINCDKYWWRNVLYINTFYSSRERCVQWSWYLSADTQLHLGGMMLLCALSSRARLALAVASALVVTAWATDSILAYSTRITDPVDGAFSLYEELMYRPWTRLGPYLVGLFCGWLLHHVDCKLQMCRMQVVLLWIGSLAVLVSIGSDLFGLELGEYGRLLYSSLSHSLWSLAIAWVAIACVTGYGGVLSGWLSHKWLFPLSRLSYCVYLVHPLVIRSLLLSADSATHIDGGLMIVYYIGASVLSLLVGLCLALTVEAPFSCLLRRALHCDPSAT